MRIPGFRHFGLKVLSIALATLLWMVVSGEQTVERALRIPLEFTNLPPELELVGDAPTSVDVRVRGSAGTLSRLSAGELVAVLDLRGARPGQRLFPLTNNDVRTPFGLEVVQITPSNIPIFFELSAAKTVPVIPQVEGEPAEGYIVGTVSADPAIVEIVGPESAVERMMQAITEPVSVEGRTATVTEVVNIGVTDPTVRLRNPGSAQVTVEIEAEPMEWAVSGVPVRAIGARGTAQVTPTQITLHVRGPREARTIGPDAFETSVDLQGLGPGEYLLPVRVVPPPRIGVIRTEPAEVRVRIR